MSGADLNMILAWGGARTGAGPNPNGKDYDVDGNAPLGPPQPNGVPDGWEIDFASVAGPGTGPDGGIGGFELNQVLSEGGASCAGPPNAGPISYGYDENGNQTLRQAQGEPADTFEYDHENRLVEATIGGVTSTYTYSGDGLRVSRTVGGATTDYVWDAGSALPVILQDSDGNTYVYGLDLISRTDGSGNQEYFLYDGLGSTRELTDGLGNVVATYEYDAFGSIRAQTGSSANEFTFTGEQVDSTGLQYLRARYYDPAIGRFLTQDPFPGLAVSPQTLNLYPYALNAPTTLIDPYGLLGCGPFGGLCDKASDLVECAANRGDCVTEPAGKVAENVVRFVGERWSYISPTIQGLDILPIGSIPLVGQAVGEVFDILAAVASEIDIVRSPCSVQPKIGLSVTNVINLGAGTAGNLLSTVPNLLISAIEAELTLSASAALRTCGNESDLTFSVSAPLRSRGKE